MDANYRMIAKTLYGLEGVLAEELKNLGAQEVKEGNRMVSFKGDKGFMYKANLSLRTALKILMPLDTFNVYSEEDLYKVVYNYDWPALFGADQTLAIDSVVFGDVFTHSLYVSQKIKDAIADRFRAVEGRRPSVDLNHPDVRIHAHIDQHVCSLSLDSSGASLHQRGYRGRTNIAPINEVLAAGILLLSGWDQRTDLLDPMCGSGTLPIEAAMLSCKIPANINRKEFAFEKWKDWDEDLFYTIEEAQLNKIQGLAGSIFGYDKAPSAVAKARENIRNANLEEFISIEKENFLFTQKDSDRPLHIITNPPYGKRLKGDIPALYAEMGSLLKHKYNGTQAWIISSHFEALKHVGLRPSKKIKLFNGKLESRLQCYDIYAGTKKVHKQNR